MSEESRMKKTIIRIAVCVVVFLASALIIGSIMNQGHNNMTMEMAPATLPMITMESGGVACNELHGNTVELDVAYQKDCITLLGEGRQANFTVDTFGREITGISTEVRSIDGSRLIENSEVTGWKANGKSFSVSLTLKDLIDTNTQYSLTLILELEGEQKVYYYTTILWNDDVHISEILEFATDFHGKLYDKEMAKELTKYLEPNSKLTDNGTFHKVNIHSSFQQITWGSLEPVQEDAASIRLTQISGNVASLLMDFVVSTGEGKNKIYYNVEEYYRVRYTSERMYLLDYERTMTQIPDTTRMYANDKILLGITDEMVLAGKEAGYAPYARILGFRKDKAALLGEIKKHARIPLVTKTADASRMLSDTANMLFQQDLYASHVRQSLLAAKTGQPVRNEYTQPICIL